MVWVGVGSGSSVLEVTIALVSALSWNTDGCTTVGNTVAEGVDCASLVPAGETESVVLTINSNMLHVTTLELLDGGFDVLHATFLSHLLAGKVAMQTRAIPVTGNRFWVEGDLRAEFFRDTVEEEARKPEVITHLDTEARTNLELPLSRHDFGVGARNLDTSVQASLVMSLNNVSAENLASANTTVVRALRSWEAIYWPTIWSIGDIEESVFLFKTEPWLVLSVSLHELGTLMTVVELVWGSIRIPAFAENQHVGSTTEWVGENSNGS